MLRSLFAHPLTKGMDTDDPRTTHLRRQVIRSKPFLRRIYHEWYSSIAAAVPSGEGLVLEIGSGAGFMKDAVPGLLTSDVFFCPDINIVLDGQVLPFAAGALRGIVMTDVLHHIPRPQLFWAEATRCVKPGGVVVMVEPWVTRWSSMTWPLNGEPFRPDAAEWEFPATGPLSGANGALPWILFGRDRDRFLRAFPIWQIQSIRLTMPFRYLLSGGVSMRALMPGWSFGMWRILEQALSRWNSLLAMYAQIVLVRSEWGPMSNS
jgi:SAM-dependent methyltransferase